MSRRNRLPTHLDQGLDPAGQPGTMGRMRLRQTLMAVAVVGLVVNFAAAQNPPVTKDAGRTDTAKGKAAEKAEAPQLGDLTTRYRFTEQYVGETDKVKPKPGDLTQYRVATRDSIKVTEEKPQGPPDVKELTMQVIYSERVAGVKPSGSVTDVVRRYETLRYPSQMANADNGQAPKLLEGLNLWIKTRVNATPLMILLEGDRRLSETEYSVNARQLFVPELASLLPTTARRVGDRWQVSRNAIQALLGDAPVRNTPLYASLVDVKKGAKTGESVAVISIAGRVTLNAGIENAVKAQVLFTFTPATVDVAAAASTSTNAGSTATGNDGIVEAHGAITELRLARGSVIPAPGGNGRLRRSFNQELVLQRQLTLVSSTAPLVIPSPPPIPTEPNSWLTYDDPQGRFHFRHPQDLLPPRDAVPMPNEVQLFDGQVGSADGSIIRMTLQPKTGDETANRNNQDPNWHMKELYKDLAESGQAILKGPAGWLPDADWSPFNMRVHRIEAALKPAGAAGKNVERVYLDYYVVILPDKESLVIEATTGQSDMSAFRKQVAAILKTFKLGPSSPQGKPG